MPKMTRIPQSDLSQLLYSYDLETSGLLRKLQQSLAKDNISPEREEFIILMRDHMVTRIEFLLKYKRRYKPSEDWTKVRDYLLNIDF